MNLGCMVSYSRGYTQNERDLVVNVMETSMTNAARQLYKTDCKIMVLSPQKKEPYFTISVFTDFQNGNNLKRILSIIDSYAYTELMSNGLLEGEYVFIVNKKQIKGLCGEFACCKGFAENKRFEDLRQIHKRIDDILAKNGLEF